jgi:hypothetical protein
LFSLLINMSTVHKERQLLSIGSLLGGLPIIGPVLQPLVPLLGAIGLSEIDASSQELPSLTEAQLSTLADLENVLLNATHEITSGISINFATASVLQTRGLFPLGSILTGLPVIGPILNPLLPLLESIGLATVDAAPGAVYSMSLTDDQSVKLAQLKDILEENIPDIMPERNGSTSPSDDPSSVSPGADAPVAILAPTRPDENSEDADATASTITASVTM